MSSLRGRYARVSSQKHQGAATTKTHRQATLYDAVAGRVSSTGFIPTHPRTSRSRRNTSYLPLPPEEILFRRRNAPERYEEDDFYWAHENLEPGKLQLPDSDLLKAVHAYASDFYGKVLGEEARVSWRSLDETALMALGVLLEEEMERVLGETGDLVFVEGAKRERVGGEEGSGRPKETKRARKARTDGKDQAGDSSQQRDAEGPSPENEEETQKDDDGDQESSSMTESSEEGRVRKRRKVELEDTETESST